MTTYNGTLKTAAKARQWTAKLLANGTTDAKAAAALLERNWQSVAGRPELAARILALVNNDGREQE